MGLSIKRVETERKARAVAARMGVGVTEAIDRALEDKREALFAYLASLPKAQGPSVQEIEAEMYGDGGEPI